jgi:MoxR-like ATPase
MNASLIEFDTAAGWLRRLRERMDAVVVGQPAVVEHTLCALLANGHALIEGVPGLGKTLLVRALAACFDGDFKRIQFTPDLMPADISGHVYWEPSENRFRMRHGPVFTNLLLADEINRAPAKTQAALLEVMQERQVTLDGQRHPLDRPFMVLATQNPIEHEGTYPLPEAELDRFLIKIRIDYPELEHEVALTAQLTADQSEDMQSLPPDLRFLSPHDAVAMQRLCASLLIDDQVLRYAVRLVRATREHPAFKRGAGTRAGLALVRTAKSHAMLRGSEFVVPDDVKAMATAVLAHRMLLRPEAELQGHTARSLLDQLLARVPLPQQRVRG